MAAADTLSVEPLDSDTVIQSSVQPEDELWLITIPANDFPLEKLNNISIHLEEGELTDDAGKLSTDITRIDERSGGLFPLIPSRKRLTFGNNLKGHVAFKKRVPIDEVKPLVVKKPKLEVSSDLYQRWTPFGMAQSSKFPSKEKKKRNKT